MMQASKGICPYCGSELKSNTTVCVCGASVEPAQIGTVQRAPDAEVPKFTFANFATAIYHERAFMLPALYGGERGDEPYEVLFVLSDPSKPFTEPLWELCCPTVEKAIEQHRSVFLQWAYKPNSNQAVLFESFSSMRSEFFRRFYVTDCWKDGTRTRRYWRRRLSIELHSVCTGLVVVIGEKAQQEVKTTLKKYDPISAPIREIVAPWEKILKRRMTPEEYKQHVSKLWDEIRALFPNRHPDRLP
jgi:hypothetical protein